MKNAIINQIISESPYPFNEAHVLLWFLMMAIYGFSEIGILIWNRRLIPKTKRQNRGVAQIMLPFFIGMFISIFEALQDSHQWVNGLFGVGTVILAGGIMVRLIALFSIGKGFSIKIERNENQKLIQSGMYKYIRHPLYLASLLQLCGSVIMLCSKWGWIVVPFSLYAVVKRIKSEELF
jgi:protein-S-isoprenylcysteine O-methyltransferase Ste14